MNRLRTIAAIAAAALAISCGQKKEEKFTPLPFPDVMPPGMMDGADAVAEYMAGHFWDRFARADREFPSDTLYVSGVLRSEVEQKFSDWTRWLSMTDIGTSRKSMKTLFDKAAACERKDTSSNIFETLTGLVEKYLYDPNSPVRNEDLYGAYAERLSECGLLDSLTRSRYARDARLCALNRIGTKAADFRFSDRKGKIYTLYGIRSEWTLLFFSNPGCKACLDIINTLKETPVISSMVQDGRLAILNIYIDEDLGEWYSYMPIYPPEWYNAFDPDNRIRTDTLYNVRAIPSLYLLDREKTVIAKDAVTENVIAFLNSVGQ